MAHRPLGVFKEVRTIGGCDKAGSRVGIGTKRAVSPEMRFRDPVAWFEVNPQRNLCGHFNGGNAYLSVTLGRMGIAHTEQRPLH